MSQRLVTHRFARWLADGLGLGADPALPSRAPADLDTPTYLRRGLAIPGISSGASRTAPRITR